MSHQSEHHPEQILDLSSVLVNPPKSQLLWKFLKQIWDFKFVTWALWKIKCSELLKVHISKEQENSEEEILNDDGAESLCQDQARSQIRVQDDC